MKLTKEEVQHIANLARIDLTDQETEDFPQQLSQILEYVGQLAECETTDVEPMAHVVPLLNVMREDEVVGCEAEVRERLLDAFPEREGDLLKVKAVFPN